MWSKNLYTCCYDRLDCGELHVKMTNPIGILQTKIVETEQFGYIPTLSIMLLGTIYKHQNE